MIEEIDLINAAIRNGDSEGWRSIYNSCYSAVKQTLFRCGFTGQDAEDLTHQTFVKILNAKKKPNFENIRSFYAWLKCVVLSVVKDTAKSKSAKDSKNILYFEDINKLLIEVPEEQAFDDSVRMKINSALNMLSEKERKLIVLRANCTPFKMISEETGIPKNGIRVYYQRTIEKLRRLMSSEGISL